MVTRVLFNQFYCTVTVNSLFDSSEKREKPS